MNGCSYFVLGSFSSLVFLLPLDLSGYTHAVSYSESVPALDVSDLYGVKGKTPALPQEVNAFRIILPLYHTHTHTHTHTHSLSLSLSLSFSLCFFLSLSSSLFLSLSLYRLILFHVHHGLTWNYKL